MSSLRNISVNGRLNLVGGNLHRYHIDPIRLINATRRTPIINGNMISRNAISAHIVQSVKSGNPSEFDRDAIVYLILKPLTKYINTDTSARLRSLVDLIIQRRTADQQRATERGNTSKIEPHQDQLRFWLWIRNSVLPVVDDFLNLTLRRINRWNEATRQRDSIVLRHPGVLTKESWRSAHERSLQQYQNAVARHNALTAEIAMIERIANLHWEEYRHAYNVVVSGAR